MYSRIHGSYIINQIESEHVVRLIHPVLAPAPFHGKFDLLPIFIKTGCQTSKAVEIQLSLEGTYLGEFKVL